MYDTQKKQGSPQSPHKIMPGATPASNPELMWVHLSKRPVNCLYHNDTQAPHMYTSRTATREAPKLQTQITSQLHIIWNRVLAFGNRAAPPAARPPSPPPRETPLSCPSYSRTASSKTERKTEYACPSARPTSCAHRLSMMTSAAITAKRVVLHAVFRGRGQRMQQRGG